MRPAGTTSTPGKGNYTMADENAIERDEISGLLIRLNTVYPNVSAYRYPPEELRRGGRNTAVGHAKYILMERIPDLVEKRDFRAAYHEMGRVRGIIWMLGRDAELLL